jgi:dTDP-4-amino-4,6-dideoxygalactose transaminase
VPEDREHAYHLMTARFDPLPNGKNRDDLIDVLYNKYKVKTIVQYWPLYRSDLFSKSGFGTAEVPHTDRFFDNMVSFPWWSDMPETLIDEMASRTHSALDELRRG